MSKSPVQRLAPRSVALALATLLCASASASEWLGTTGSAFSNPANWKGGAPASGSDNPQLIDFRVLNESLNPLRYTAAEGDTVLGSSTAATGQFIVGLDDKSGRFEISGGNLRIYSYWSPILAQSGFNTTGTIHVSGGVLRISNTNRTKPEERFFRVGNTAPRPAELRSNGAIFISGGTLIVDCQGGPETSVPGGSFQAGGLNVGRCNGSGLIYLTGGLLRVTSPNGTSFVPDNGRASGIVTFGLGEGVFEQTSSNRLTFGTNPESDAYINFQPGSKGSLSLFDASVETFARHVQEGRIRIDGGITDMSRFHFTRDGSQGVLRLASADQP